MDRWLRVIARRFRALFRRAGADRELDDELRYHIERTTDEHVMRGVPAPEARRRALVELGGVEARKEACREARGVVWQLDVLAQDVRASVRSLGKAPGVTAVAILSLALGIGANATVFSMVSAILLEPLPYPDPGRLVMIRAVHQDRPDEETAATAPEYWAWRTQSSLFEAMGSTQVNGADLGADGSGAAAERVDMQFFMPSMFRVLGVRPAIGRAFEERDAPIGRPARIVLISDSMWTRRFNRDPAVVTRTLRLDGETYAIVGVMPPRFGYPGPDSADVWVPHSLNPRQLQGSARAFAVAARLKPGVTIPQAQAEIERIAASVVRGVSGPAAGWGARVVPMHEALYGSMRHPLQVLVGVVASVLLIACANVAGLLLARAASRRGELAIRAAIGAGRARLVRQLLTESVLLAIAGGMAGLVVGWAGLEAVVALGPETVPRLADVTLDQRALWLTAFVALLTSLVFGLAPALRASGGPLAGRLTVSARAIGDPADQQRLRSAMVIVQIALAVVLLSGSALLIRTFTNLHASDLGADPRGVLSFEVTFSQNRFLSGVGTFEGRPLVEVSPIPSRTYARLQETIQTLPGVDAVAAIHGRPFPGGLSSIPFSIEGRPDAATPQERLLTAARLAMVTPGFFDTMKIPVLRGRDFGASDTATAPWGVVINEAMARKYWPDQNPIGRRITLHVVTDERPREVIGVVGNAKLTPYERVATPVMYTLHMQQPVHSRAPVAWQRTMMTFLIRTDLDAPAIVPPLRRAMAAIDPDRPLTDVRPLDAVVADQLDEPRYAGSLVGVFAGMAVLLAATGLFGVMAFGVAQRTREIGIRMALGASRGLVLRSILRQALLLVGAALVIGLAGALAAGRLLTSFLWGVTPTDPATYVGVGLIMASAAALAVVVPARRALGIAPTIALRQE